MRRPVNLPPPPGAGPAAGPDTVIPPGTGAPAGAVAGVPVHGAEPGPGYGPHRPCDAAVIERSWQDPEQFAALFDRHAGEMYRYAARRLGPQAAADVVSEVFLAAFRNRGGYDVSRPDARPWLYGISARVISQQLRTDGRRARAMAATPAPRPAELPVDDITDRVTAAQLRPRMLRVLGQLSAADRELVLLVAWAGLSYEETAQALEIPLGTVRSRLHRARARIRRALGPAFADEESSHG
ncbi:MAG: RNA polymerase sigma factor [Streptosporangiaceae bacterium]